MQVYNNKKGTVNTFYCSFFIVLFLRFGEFSHFYQGIGKIFRKFQTFPKACPTAYIVRINFTTLRFCQSQKLYVFRHSSSKAKKFSFWLC